MPELTPTPERAGLRCYARFLAEWLRLDVEVRDDRLLRAAADARLAAALRGWLRELERDYGQAGVQAFSARARPLVEELERRLGSRGKPELPVPTTELAAPWWRFWGRW